MGASIKDVAKLAGVSTATVSRTFNQPDKVSEKTKKIVLNASHKLDYYPSFTAKNFATGKNQMLGFVVLTRKEFPITQSSWDFYFQILQGINKNVNIGNKYHCWFNSTTYSEEKENKWLINLAKSNEIDGLFILLQWDYNDDFLWTLGELKRLKLPIVLINRLTNIKDICSVKINNFEIGQLAANYLISRHHKKIAFFSGNCLNLAVKERENGFFSLIEKKNFKRNDIIHINSGFDVISGYNNMLNLLDLHKYPSAIFCINDLVAAGALRALNEKNINCPEDIELISVDDSEFASALIPTLTTFKLPLYKVGEKASELLLKKINNKNISIKENNFSYSAKLIERGSTK